MGVYSSVRLTKTTVDQLTAVARRMSERRAGKRHLKKARQILGVITLEETVAELIRTFNRDVARRERWGAKRKCRRPPPPQAVPQPEAPEIHRWEDDGGPPDRAA